MVMFISENSVLLCMILLWLCRCVVIDRCILVMLLLRLIGFRLIILL